MPYHYGVELSDNSAPVSEYLDGDIFKVTLLNNVPLGEVGPMPGQESLLWGAEVDPKHMPTKMYRGGGRKRLTDASDTLYGPRIISSKTKDLIEEIEPDVHQFFPLALFDKSKKHIADYWAWVVCNRVDGVDREHTNYFLIGGRLWFSNYRDEDGNKVKVENPRMVFNLAQIGDRHFWRDSGLYSDPILMSDYAAERFSKSDLTGFRLSHYVEAV